MLNLHEGVDFINEDQIGYSNVWFDKVQDKLKK